MSRVASHPRQVAIRVKIEGNLPVTVFKEGALFVAYTPALDLSTCGRTFKEAQKNFDEAVTLFFDHCLEQGTLPEVLASLGWQKTKSPTNAWRPPEVVGRFDHPVALSV